MELKFFILIIFISLSDGCEISKRSLEFIANEMAKELRKYYIPIDESNCDRLIKKTLDFSTQLIKEMKTEKFINDNKKAEIDPSTHDKEFDDIKILFNKENDDNLRLFYSMTFDSLNASIQEIKDEILEKLETQFFSQMKMEFYIIVMNENDGKFFDNESEKNCNLTESDLGLSLLESFYEIRDFTPLLNLGANDCYQVTRDMIAIRGLLTQKKSYDENKLKILKLSVDEQLRITEKFGDHITSENKDYESLDDDLKELREFLKQISDNEQNIQKFSTIKGIQSFKNSFVTITDENIDMVYQCNDDAIVNIENFIVNSTNNFMWLIDDMKKCEHYEIFESISSKSYETDVKNIYENLKNKFKMNVRGAIEDVRQFEKLLDLYKLLVKLYNGKFENFRLAKLMIEELSPNYFLEETFLNEISSDEYSKKEHFFKLGIWLKKRQKALAEDFVYNRKVESLYNNPKFPSVVKKILFNSFELIDKNSRYFIFRPQSAPPLQYLSLKASLKSSENDEKISIYLYEAERSYNYLCKSKHGDYLDFVDEYPFNWNLNFTDDCDQCVTLQDSTSGKYLTTDKNQYCVKKGFFGNCKTYNHRNIVRTTPTTLKIQ